MDDSIHDLHPSPEVTVRELGVPCVGGVRHPHLASVVRVDGEIDGPLLAPERATPTSHQWRNLDLRLDFRFRHAERRRRGVLGDDLLCLGSGRDDADQARDDEHDADTEKLGHLLLLDCWSEQLMGQSPLTTNGVSFLTQV